MRQTISDDDFTIFFLFRNHEVFRPPVSHERIGIAVECVEVFVRGAIVLVAALAACLNAILPLTVVSIVGSLHETGLRLFAGHNDLISISSSHSRFNHTAIAFVARQNSSAILALANHFERIARVRVVNCARETFVRFWNTVGCDSITTI